MGKIKFQIDKKRLIQLVKKYKPTFKFNGLEKDAKELIFLTQNFLEFIAASNIAMMMPDSKSYFKIVKNRDEILKNISNWKLKHSTNYLKKQKIINNKFNLTKKGFNNSFFILVNKLFIKIPRIWDKKWRMVIFDLPQNFAGNRDFLRQRLTDFGFIQVQKSVWAFPFDCEKEINFLIELIQTKPYTYFLISEFKNDHKFIKHFKKIYPKQFKNH
jgi:hypothetical protein